jgi:hypothetical protein
MATCVAVLADQFESLGHGQTCLVEVGFGQLTSFWQLASGKWGTQVRKLFRIWPCHLTLIDHFQSCLPAESHHTTMTYQRNTIHTTLRRIATTRPIVGSLRRIAANTAKLPDFSDLRRRQSFAGVLCCSG